MRSSVSNAAPSDPVRSLDNIGPASDQIGPKQLKAGLRAGLGFAATMRDAIIAHYGSVKAAAISLAVDPSLMMREFTDGKFGRFDAKADADAKAAVSSRLGEVFGVLSDPRARARQKVREVLQALHEIDQFLEHIA